MSREEGGLKGKLKNLFRSKPSHAPSECPALKLTNQQIEEISSSSPAGLRERKIIELAQLAEKQRLEPTAPEAITVAIQDLLVSQDTPKRRVALSLIHAIIKGQDEELGMLRDYYFNLLLKHEYGEDLPVLLAILRTLTKDGYDLNYIDHQIGVLLVAWLKDLSNSETRTEFLDLLAHIIKYNAAFIEEDSSVELFQMCCEICNKSRSEKEIQRCLLVLENIIKYYYVKSDALLPLCMTLSRTVLTESFVQSSWKLMRELLGTHLGHSALFTLTGILQNRENLNDSVLQHGAIFFIGMALWASQRVDTLHVSATAVLPAFKVALASNNTKVAYEVSLTVLRLVRKYGKSQPSILWDHVLDILDHLHDLIKRGAPHDTAITEKISNNLHDVLTAMEDLQDSCTYSSSPDRLFEFIEMCSASRPEASVTMLLEHRAVACRPSDDDWLSNLENLLNKYYKTETRATIRLKALNVFSQIVATNKTLHEDELLDMMLTTFAGVYADVDVTIRCRAVQVLAEQAKSCTSKKCIEILSLLEKIANRETRPNLSTSGRTAETEQNCADILAAVTGLVDIFKSKLYEPRTTQALLPLEALLSHMSLHYGRYHFSPTASKIKKLVLTLFLEFKADWRGRVGLEGMGYASYLFISERYLPHNRQLEDSLSVPIDHKVISFNSILKIINSCLRKEVDWGVLSMVLNLMPKQWQNKCLILSVEPSMVDTVCRTLCDMVMVKDLRKMYNTPASKSDFDEQIFPVLTCMTAYHSCLLTAKADLIRCLQFGLLTKCARICVHTLRVCCLEMESIMMKMLPDILGTLSRIVANKNMALPLLMFLSCLVRLPRLYRNFNDSQYKFIFAIALPYTDPSQFQHFPVYLAYHVIIMWFVKCRLMYRKQFVQQIIKSLQTHTKSIKESQLPTHPESSNREDLGEINKTLFFHQELQETCIDIMSRYTFSNLASLPKRTAVTKFLLEGGRSKSWFVGNKIITITTSGVGSRVTKSGLCPRCAASVRGETQPTPLSTPTSAPETNRSRQRHQSAYASTSTEPIDVPPTFSQDDMIHQKFHTISESGGSSCSTERESAEDLFSAIAQSSDGQFNMGECNCWCNGWAEIYMHRPSGDTSWVLRIQNKQLFNFEEFPLADISMFMASPHKSPYPATTPVSQQRMIESGSLEEKEYEEQHEQHFKGPAAAAIGNSSAIRRISLQHAEGDDSESAPVAPLPTEKGVLPAVTISRPASFAGASVAEVEAPVSSTVTHLSRSGARSVTPTSGSSHVATSNHGFGSGDSAFTRQTSMHQLEFENGSLVIPELEEEEEDIVTTLNKPRSKTFSYPSGMSKPKSPDANSLAARRLNSNAAKDRRAGILPNFVFLQLYQMGVLHSSNVPVPIPDNNEEYARGLNNLRRISPYETHKVGIVYVGKGQANDERAILRNSYGSQRYSQFLKRLGTLLTLKYCDPKDMYIGGLDHQEGIDGKYTYAWHDEVVQMVFHVATMMPTSENDPKCGNKKRHIGNDYVTIVYNDSGQAYSLGTIKGQFNYVNIVIEPLDLITNSVSVLCKEEIKPILEHVSTKVISDTHVASLVQQIALHSSMASLICKSMNDGVLFASNWLERLRKLKQMKEKVRKSRRTRSTESGEWVTDFTEYS
ncbi:tuberin-like isoform X2 [Watersipora subatra]|uniref:tuberin-like isoform X2 n=1 Tax=Watersipora subatra TaxID=2589382 RepID=UPI00355B9B4F